MQNHTKRLPYRQNHKTGACQPRSHSSLACEASELHAREPLQDIPPEMDYDAVAF